MPYVLSALLPGRKVFPDVYYLVTDGTALFFQFFYGHAVLVHRLNRLVGIFFASFKIAAASSLALRKILSRRSSNRSDFVFNSSLTAGFPAYRH